MDGPIDPGMENVPAVAKFVGYVVVHWAELRLERWLTSYRFEQRQPNVFTRSLPVVSTVWANRTGCRCGELAQAVYKVPHPGSIGHRAGIPASRPTL